MARDDRTEAPTPRRKREARKEGQIPKSVEVVAWLQVLVATFVIELTAQRAHDVLRRVLERSGDAMATADPGVALAVLGDALGGSVLAVLPLAGAMMAVGIMGQVAQTGGFASLAMLKPKPKRLNPITGLKRLFSPQGLWHGAKSLLKVGMLAVVAWPPLHDLTRTLVASGQLELGAVASAVASATLRICRQTALLGLAIAALDYGMQRRRVMQGMRMTKQEVKDEHRQSEGDPHVRGQIRQRQLAMGRNRMIAAVADANVVIVNPTHVAVALRYLPGHGAPRLVAKGQGAVADRIREEAERHRVPIVRDIPLARTIEATVRLGTEIPTDLYEAVARILAFLGRIGRRSAFGGVLQVPPPTPAMAQPVA